MTMELKSQKQQLEREELIFQIYRTAVPGFPTVTFKSEMILKKQHLFWN